MLDGTLRRTDADAGQPTGRIKCGTESNGGFRNINCIFESCRGFALESVDGGPIEDITFTGVTMRDIRNAPFFLRLGARLRGPAGTRVATFKRVLISNIICDAPANDMPAIVAGIPGHPIEDVSVSDVLLVQKGGASAALADIDPPEQEWEYPEPSSLARCLRADCWYVTPRTSRSIISKSLVFKRTRGRSYGSAMLMARLSAALARH